jgi:hypothetical protein
MWPTFSITSFVGIQEATVNFTKYVFVENRKGLIGDNEKISQRLKKKSRKPGLADTVQ